jgi:hypothetical protein
VALTTSKIQGYNIISATKYFTDFNLRIQGQYQTTPEINYSIKRSPSKWKISSELSGFYKEKNALALFSSSNNQFNPKMQEVL